ncbi:Flagellar L-ring protein [Desulfamplus magnetovallimortis]|uniref:Flagellar L-ring protein n=1 Tax=Desulfamplus magnetovallimortis TaxID=1246637 RepID=A0A1W1HA19_9BACT|nr:flagellar basal body L-ring protein FlgH [Desulfamplus magnetovallimortis]SLM29228.1 Flagellar L-ring protein [Desulfamplus magnetovallimortis]
MNYTDKKTIQFSTAASIVLLFLFLSGCAAVQQETGSAVTPPGISEEPSLQVRYEPLPPSEGSLWTEESDPFFEDTKARQPGDTLIVDIVENATSSMDASTEAKRSTSMDIGVPNFFGYMRQFEALPNPVTKGMLADKIVGTKYDNAYTGEGKSNRNGSITASIAARITEILPNGNYVIYGKRAIKVNQEVQYIVVSGIVRPEDIGDNNKVQSTYLADSRIEYFGHGVIADKQQQGWGTRLFDNLWPF